jgi:hypothetical protein
MYNLLSGKLLFTGRNVKEVLQKNMGMTLPDIKVKVLAYSRHA